MPGTVLSTLLTWNYLIFQTLRDRYFCYFHCIAARTEAQMNLRNQELWAKFVGQREQVLFWQCNILIYWDYCWLSSQSFMKMIFKWLLSIWMVFLLHRIMPACKFFWGTLGQEFSNFVPWIPKYLWKLLGCLQVKIIFITILSIICISHCVTFALLEKNNGE